MITDKLKTFGYHGFSLHSLPMRNGWSNVLRFSLLWLIIIAGCAQRQRSMSTPQMNVEPQFWVRVLLLENTKNCTLKIASPFAVLDAATAVKQAGFDQFHTPISVNISAAKITIAGRSFRASEVIIMPDEPYIFNLNGNNYRGKLKIVLAPDGNSFNAVNLVPLEPYLAGVVGAEMPDYWQPAALQAQAIAARTYCLYIKQHFGRNRSWDVKKTAANQVYLGVKAESKRVWDAVNKTYGQVLVAKSKKQKTQYAIRNTQHDIFPTYYSSICGGHTENSKYVFGDSFEPLVGVLCSYCKDIVQPGTFFWPMAQFDKAEVTTRLLRRYPKLKKLGNITNITVAKQSSYGKFSRLTLVKLHGSTGKTGYLRAEDFRLSIDSTGRKFRSTICKIVNMDGAGQTQNKPANSGKWAFASGRGWGHGVGLCQFGAQAMARQDKTATQILFLYYPGSKIRTLDY